MDEASPVATKRGSALTEMLTHARSASVLIRPRTGYPGLAFVRTRLARETGTSLLVTNLLPGGSEVVAAGGARSVRCVAFHTSGSTGTPKCVIYRSAQVRTHADAVAAALRLGSHSRSISLVPPGFAYGLSILFSHDRLGLPVFFAAAGAGFVDREEWAVDSNGPLAMYALPQQVPLLLNAQIDAGRVERVFIAGGRLSGPSVGALAKKFPNLRLTNMYGQAEMGPRLSVWDGDPKDYVEGSIGKPISGVQLKLADEERGRTEPVPLMASSEHAMWKCLKPPYEEFEDGPAPGEFIDTGDLAMRAPDGGLIHCGRGDHVLNVAGTKIDVRRVTRLIEERFRPIVVRITSKPSRVAGDVLPVVEIVPSPGETITKRDVRQTLHADYGNLASLFDVLIVDQLNLGESGK